MVMDEEFFLRRGMLERPIPGLVRMDRALLYLRHRMRSIISDLEARGTKTIGDGGYHRLVGFSREAISLCSMSGDRDLPMLIMRSTRSLTSRTHRRDAIEAAKELLVQLESYQPPVEAGGLGDFTSHGDGGQSGGFDGSSTTKVTDQQLTSEHSVFIIMPFAAEFADVWKGGIQMAAKAAGFTPIRVDMINRSTNITDDIVEAIDKCRLVIVDVTKNNPNVMFELGYAMAKAKKSVIISQSADFLPFDIRNIRTIVYQNTWSGIEDLRARIQEFLKDSAPSKHTKRSA
jgi:hypothetical protein